MKKLFCCPALELFHCLPLWKTVLFVSSRAFSLSTPPFLLSTPVENSEATWKKATKCNKYIYLPSLYKPMQNSEITKNRALPSKTSHMLQIQTINRLFLSHLSIFLPCLRVKLEKTTKKKNKKTKRSNLTLRWLSLRSFLEISCLWHSTMEQQTI